MGLLLTWLLWGALLSAMVGGLWTLYRTPPQVSLRRELAPSAFQGARTAMSLRVKVSSVTTSKMPRRAPSFPTWCRCLVESCGAPASTDWTPA